MLPIKNLTGSEGIDSAVLCIVAVADVETDSVAVAVFMVLVAAVDVVAGEILWFSSQKKPKIQATAISFFYIFKLTNLRSEHTLYCPRFCCRLLRKFLRI